MRVNQIIRENDLAKGLYGEEGTFVAQQSNAFGQPIGPAMVLVCKRGHSIISARPVVEATVLPWEIRKVSDSTEAGEDSITDRQRAEERASAGRN